MTNHPEIERTPDAVVPGRSPAANGAEARVPRLVHRDGLAYVEGCDVPIWQLEMSRRAGSSPTAMMKVFPVLTPEALDLAAAYARQHPDEIDTLIRERGPMDVPLDEEEDDEEGYQADLDEIFEEYGEVFRRLAQ